MVRLFRREKPQKPPMPKWLKWALLALVAYALIIGPHKQQTRGAYQKAEHDLNPNNLLHIGDYKSKIFPPSLRTKELAPGNGLPAICGQEVNIAYNSFFADGKPTGDSASTDKPLTFTLGGGSVMPALDQGALGMKPQSKRDIVAPASLAYGAEGFAREGVPADATVDFKIEMLSASPTLPGGPFHITQVKNGIGAPILCGGQAKVNVTVWSVDGKKLYATSEPLVFTPGKSEVFLALEQGVLDMSPGSQRTLIVPPDFQKTLNGQAPSIKIPLPEHQTVLVDIEALP